MKTCLATIAAILLTSLCVLHAQDAAAKKPPVGVPNDAKFFQSKWYRVYTERHGWKQARAKCEQLGGRLVIIPDEATQTFVSKLADGLRLWLGANDEQVDGRWLWTDGSVMKYKVWDKGQPDNSGGHEQFLDMEGNGGWNDSAPNNPLIVGFICEWDAR